MSQTAKRRLKPAELREIRGKVRTQLLSQGISQVKNADIDVALTWRSIAPLLEEEPLPIEHIANNICAYLPRNLRKQPANSEAQNVPYEPGRELDTRNGIAYALAIHAYKNERSKQALVACRQHYWQQETAPFPWIQASRSQRTEAQQQALEWLGTNEAHYPRVAGLRVAMNIDVPDSQAFKRAALAIVAQASQEQPQLLLERLGKLMIESGARFSNFFRVPGDYIADVDIRHSGTPFRA